jgi:polysaccharide biosynthesis/export protein
MRILVALSVWLIGVVGQVPIGVAQSISREIVEPFRAEDRIRLTVAGFPDLSGEQSIGPDGTIQLPMAGSIAIASLTAPEAVSRIQTSLLPYVRRPQVGIVLVKRGPMHISITGQVVRPGPRLLSPDERETNVPMTLSKALIVAGGIRPSADLRNVTVRRAKSAIPGQSNEVKVDLWQAIQTGDLAADLKIRSGDEIIVPTAQSVNGENKVALASTLAPDKVTIQVTGEVQTPGQLEMKPTSGVSAAIAAAGGFTKEAKRDNIALFRVQPDGRLEKRPVAFGNDSDSLMNGDLIVVEKTRRGALGDVFDFLGRVVNPFAPLLRLFGSGN